MKTGKAEPRIVFMGRYNDSEMLSGPEKVAKRIFSEHTKHNKAVFIQYFFDGRKFDIGKKLFAKEEQKISDNAVLYTAGLFKVYGLLKKLNPDIIHIIMFERFAVIALIYKFFNKVKVIYNEHGVVAYENSELKQTAFIYRLKDKLCEKRFLKGSDKILFVSLRAVEIAKEYYNFDESKVIIISNGVDNIFYNNSQKDFPAILKAVFIYQNELYNSGLKFLRNYMEKFKQPIELYIISNSAIDVYFKATVVKPMTACELAEFYINKHIFLALNKYDTFSISTVEAMASGLVPIITTETGASRYIENCYNGYTLPYKNIESLNDAVNSFIELPGEAKQKMSQNAAHIYIDLKWENVYDSYKNIYNSLFTGGVMK